MITKMDAVKYYELCIKHVSIDKPVNYPTNCRYRKDDYPFMDFVEKQLNVKEVGNFRDEVATKGSKFLHNLIEGSVKSDYVN